MRTVIASSFDFKIDAYGKAERSGQGRGVQTGALAFPTGGERWGNATGHYKRRGSAMDIISVVAVRSNQCPIKQRGAGRPDPPRPLPPSQVSPHTEGDVEKSDDEIAAGLGREPLVSVYAVGDSSQSGTKTASAIPLSDNAMTAAHKSLPFIGNSFRSLPFIGNSFRGEQEYLSIAATRRPARLRTANARWRAL
jgi:hypothetical protein